jgi:hypothetical protein
MREAQRLENFPPSAVRSDFTTVIARDSFRGQETLSAFHRHHNETFSIAAICVSNEDRSTATWDMLSAAQRGLWPDR